MSGGAVSPELTWGVGRFFDLVLDAVFSPQPFELMHGEETFGPAGRPR